MAFLVVVAGWQGPAWEQDPARVQAEARAAGLVAADVERGVAFARRRMALICGGGPFAELDRERWAVQGERWFRHVHACDAALFASARRLVGHDYGPSWERVRCPVLAVYGDRDTSTARPGGRCAASSGEKANILNQAARHRSAGRFHFYAVASRLLVDQGRIWFTC